MKELQHFKMEFIFHNLDLISLNHKEKSQNSAIKSHNYLSYFIIAWPETDFHTNQQLTAVYSVFMLVLKSHNSNFVCVAGLYVCFTASNLYQHVPVCLLSRLYICVCVCGSWLKAREPTCLAET